MSATLHRPTPAPPTADGREDRPGALREDTLMLATLALLTTACLPLARVYLGLSFFRPVLGAVLLALGLSWGARRLGAGPVGALLISIGGWVAFVSAAFLSDSLFAGVLPTGATLSAGATLWVRGLELMQLRPSPAFAEAGLMFITVTGVWAVTHAVEGLVIRLSAPLLAILMSMVLWLVPLTFAPSSNRAWLWAVPFLASAALLMLAFAGSDLRRWGSWTPGTMRGQPKAAPSLLPSGAVLAVVAIVAGAVLAGALPGFGDKPWYELRGMGGTTLTTNPIVDIRTRLVAEDTGPVMRVTTERPVYLRTTALDVYSDAEEWTNAGIRGAPINGEFPWEVDLGPVERVRLGVEVLDLPQAVLVPTPYQALSVSGPIADQFQYDRSNSTVTLDEGATLERADTYSITAAVPSPDVSQLRSATVSDNPKYTQLPSNVPNEVRRLASNIVQRADASTPFDQALALQRELRSWRYSVKPPQGHGGQAMLAFITNRVGYCEQYAGTMAVMLRSLGLPARVAVGFTPGDVIDPGSNAYTVTNGHAHAWVEVLFDELGWIAFEPTPRSDGNVLVPTATNVAPGQTAAETEDRSDDGSADVQDFNNVQRDENLRNLNRGDQQPTEAATAPPVAGAQPGGGGGRGLGSPAIWYVLLGLVGTAVLAAGVVSTRGHKELPGRPPLERVLHARAEVEHLARGMGMTPVPWETDHEYLSRVAHRSGGPALQAAEILATQVGRARYARQLAEQSAIDAEHASARLQAEMLREHSGLQRAAIRLRGRSSAFVARLGDGLRQRSSSSRRRAASR